MSGKFQLLILVIIGLAALIMKIYPKKEDSNLISKINK